MFFLSLGGAGGGIIKFDCDELKVDGTVGANGGDGSLSYSGGGSGGSILASTKILDGIGEFQVKTQTIITYFVSCFNGNRW